MGGIDPQRLAVGDKVQASDPESARHEEQPIGIVTGLVSGMVTFLAEGEYDMFYGPGDEGYYTRYEEPRTVTVPVSAVRYHWPQDT